MEDAAFTELRNALQQNGFCIAERLLPSAMIRQLQQISDKILTNLDPDHRARNKSQGSLVHLADHPEYASIIGEIRLLDAFVAMDFSDPRYSSGYLISKPANSPALFWHQDWWGWDDSLSYADEIAQIFVMIYLTDTTPHNGCLRVIPGSHRRPHPLHNAIQAHDESLSRVVDPTHELYQMQEGAVPVPVRAGDVVFGDARLLHSTFPNQSNVERSLLTLWYHPNHQVLPAPMRATIRQIFDRTTGDTDPSGPDARTLDDWPDDAKQVIAPVLLPKISGVKPHEWNRVPNWTGHGHID